MHPLRSNQINTGNGPRTNSRSSGQETASAGHCEERPRRSNLDHFTGLPRRAHVLLAMTDRHCFFHRVPRSQTGSGARNGASGSLRSSRSPQGAPIHDTFVRKRNRPRPGRARRHTTLLLALILSSLLLHFVPAPAALAYTDTERSFKSDAPFLPTPNYVIAELLVKAGVGKDDVLYDLGSGDGRIVIEAARQTGCLAVGIEIDADLVDDSRKAAQRAGVSDRTRFVVGDIFAADFSEATVVTLYMGQPVNIKLRPKLLRELRPGTRVASYTFDMGEWRPDAVSSFGREDAYFWVIPQNATGTWSWTEGKGKPRGRWELELKQAFQEITGQVVYRGKPYALQGGKMSGEEIRFTLSGEPFGKGGPVDFSGRVRGHSIEGTIADGAVRRPWRATRNPDTMQPIAR